jgi:imidazolonepropionase-like amidohydrolase
VTSAAQAALEVRRRFAEGASMVKVTVASLPEGAPRLTPAELHAIVAQAHQLGLKVAAHIDTAADALTAARAGVDLLAHGIETSVLTAEEAAELARLHVTVATTLVNYRRFCQLRDGEYAPDALAQAAEPAELLAQFSAAHVAGAKLSPGFKGWGDALDAHQADRLANARRLFEAGVTVVAGSDAEGSVGTFASDLHAELELLVQAGLPPVEVLLGATSRAAALLQASPSFGTIEVGKSADLLLVAGNPLEDITATRRIALVVVRGQVLQRRAGPAHRPHEE